jgi:hypothetical protein
MIPSFKGGVGIYFFLGVDDFLAVIFEFLAFPLEGWIFLETTGAFADAAGFDF